jgi:hypothetical protein
VLVDPAIDGEIIGADLTDFHHASFCARPIRSERARFLENGDAL